MERQGHEQDEALRLFQIAKTESFMLLLRLLYSETYEKMTVLFSYCIPEIT